MYVRVLKWWLPPSRARARVRLPPRHRYEVKDLWFDSHAQTVNLTNFTAADLAPEGGHHMIRVTPVAAKAL